MNALGVGGKRQSWFNSHDLVAESALLKVLQQRPVKHAQNPILVADRPWEGTLVQLYSGDVHHDPETRRWQMWYEGHPQELLVCTAFSEDGIRWTKPSLGVQEWKGSTDNNIVLQTGYWDAHCMSVLKAPEEKNPARRYRLYYWVGAEWWDPNNPVLAATGNKIKEYKKSAWYVAYSPDGIRFTPEKDAPVFEIKDKVSDFNTIFFDEQRGKYVSYHKFDARLAEFGDLQRRYMAMAVSDDGLHFSPSVPVLIPDAADDAWAREHGGIRAEFYGMHVWPHDGFYLGLLWMFMVTKTGKPPFNRGWDDGPILPHLIYSADGLKWNRLPAREPFIPPGPAGSFDAGMIFPSGDHPVVVGDEVRFYYHGTTYTHGFTEPLDSPNVYAGAGLATLPRDRYVGWLGATRPGTLQTRPLTFSGRGLHLNLDAHKGETRVALLDAEGQPLPGYSQDDCVPMTADGFDQMVRWRQGGDLSAISGKPVCVQFSLRHSVLYTWQFR